MRLSDVKGERTLEVIAALIEPMAAIAGDPAAGELFRREKLPQGEDPRRFLAGRIQRSLPGLLREHKGDVIKILAAVEGVSPRAYAKGLDLVKLLADCVELLTDEAFTTLFISAQGGEASSGSARGSTTAPAR